LYGSAIRPKSGVQTAISSIVNEAVESNPNVRIYIVDGIKTCLS
jgi:hypothetical protein